MTDFSRRTFLSTTALGVSWPFVRGLDGAWQAADAPPAKANYVTFDAAEFPVIDAGPLRAVPGARTVTTVDALNESLSPGEVLVWRHGSAFPAAAWPGIARFLNGGGSLFYAGGEPFTRPVRERAGVHALEPRTVAYLQSLRLNQSYRLEAGGAVLRRFGPQALAGRTLPDHSWIAALEPRFSTSKHFPSESGSPGTREALLRPLMYAHRPSDDSRFPFAAAAYAIDRLRGPFAGGRWVFWLASSPPSEEDWAFLIHQAARRPIDLRVDPAYGCFHDGEVPAVTVSAHVPGGDSLPHVPIQVHVDGPDGASRTQAAALTGDDVRVALEGKFVPGLYRVSVDCDPLGRATTGFWIFDPQLFGSGASMVRDDRDAYSLRRIGQPQPMVGTTTMSGTVHRDFLFEPNAAVWDDTFAELASVELNVIRTGLWSGWRRIVTDDNVVDEGFLRAVEAFYLTARKHGLPVIFTLFAFVPDDFGTANPYFSPDARAGQRAFLTALARRMAPAKEFMWDLINEPSFASPANLWSLRPSGSDAERTAFKEWLARRYSAVGNSDDGRADWETAVRQRWRLRADESIDLPAEEDFSDAYIMGARRPYRALDYALFAQDSFEEWIRDMRSALREGGSTGAITVGQDEAGLGTSPAPLFHHGAVDFTSMHTWWNNDALLWDGVLSKGTGTPLLISETGIMQRQRLSGEALRTPEDFADLLSRKIGYAFAAGAFGVIQWCYETNPFMDSDNEAAIGLKRVDGSLKPEHKVLADAAAFVARNWARFDGYVAPDVALIVPTAEQFSPRTLSAVATRACVRAFYEALGVRVRAVADHMAHRDLGQPAVIVLPACRGVASWDTIRAAVEKGSTLVCSGWFETDDAGLPAARLGAVSRLEAEPRPLRAIEPMPALEDGATDVFRFGGTIPESWYATNAPAPRRWRLGAGTIVHHPLPVEWAEPSQGLARFYRAALAGTKAQPTIELLAPPKRTVFDRRGPSYLDGLVVVTVPFREAWLVVAVNESARAEHIAIRSRGGTARVEFDVRRGRARMAFVDPRTWTLLDLS